MIADRVEIDVERLALSVHEDSDPHGELMHAARAEGSWSNEAEVQFTLLAPKAEPRHTIELSAQVASNPTAAVAALARETCRAKLLELDAEDIAAEEGDTLIDLATIYFGFGVFTANAILQETDWQSAGGSGWSMQRHGYLTYPEAGYALALYAVARWERKPAWAKHLRSDARAPFRKAMRVLSRC